MRVDCPLPVQPTIPTLCPASMEKLTSSRARFSKGVFDMQKYYANKYSYSLELKEKINVRGYLDVLPVAVMAGDEVFINDAKTYLEGNGYCVGAIIRDLKERHSMRNSYAYRVGKAIVLPFSWLKKKCKRDK